MTENDNRGQGDEKLPNNKDKGTKAKSKKLNHYTTLPVLLNMLKHCKLVLTNPDKWEDKNDSEIIAEYRRRNKVEVLFALCFSYGSETIHHWKAFADGDAGCCIEFNREMLEEQLGNHEDHGKIRYRYVEYKKIKEVGNLSIKSDDIPFTKRLPYRCEKEYRIIWEGETSEKVYKIGFELAIIQKITFSQRMPEDVYTTIKTHLKDLLGKESRIKINQSTLYANKEWINAFNS